MEWTKTEVEVDEKMLKMTYHHDIGSDNKLNAEKVILQNRTRTRIRRF